MRILIAEDDAVSRRILEKAVTTSGHTCLVAADGAEAWVLFQGADIDVLISDWMMPGLDGTELCRRVRASRQATYTYIVLLTALADKAHRLAGLEAGADDYLSKPLDRAELTARLLAAERVTTLYRRLAEQQAETRAVLDATGEAILLLDPQRHVRTGNRRFGELFGLEPADVFGRAIDELHPILSRIFGDVAPFDPVPVGDSAPLADVIQHWPERRDLARSLTAVESATGTPLGQLYAFRDVTSERAADRMKAELVSLVSHELRTPLTSIKGYVDLLLSGDFGALTTDQQEFLGIARSNTARMAALVNDLLDLSRMEAGKIDLVKTALDPAGLVREVTASLRPQLAAKRQTFSLDLAEGLPPIWADRGRIQQILTNLLSNAHKYTPEGGAITVTVRVEGDQIHLAVQDTGIGLTPEDQAKLFQKFFRSQNPMAQAAGGTGLGLAITRALVELHGGTIVVTSAPGQGSTFSVLLPVLAAAAPA